MMAYHFRQEMASGEHGPVNPDPDEPEDQAPPEPIEEGPDDEENRERHRPRKLRHP